MLAAVRVLLLMCMAWSGPFPWCHSHGTLANASPGQKELLREHLRSHHPLADPNLDVLFGWHVHFEFPRDGEQQRRPPLQLSQNLNGSDLATMAKVASEFVTWNSMISLSVSPGVVQLQSYNPANHFSDGFAPDLALPLRYGVIRC